MVSKPNDKKILGDVIKDGIRNTERDQYDKELLKKRAEKMSVGKSRKTRSAEVLVVMAKIRYLIREKYDMCISRDAFFKLSENVRDAIKKGVKRARMNRRKTIKGRDL